MRRSSVFIGESSTPETGFRWVVPDLSWEGTKGQRRRSVQAAKQRHLVPAREGGRGDSRTATPLDDNPALFREFADLKPREDAILWFANAHGQLFPEERCFEVRPVGENPTWGLPLADWTERINEMNSAVSLWDAAVIQDDSDAVSEWIQYVDGCAKMKEYPLLAIYKRIRWSLDFDRTGLTDAEMAKRIAIVSANGIANHCLSEIAVLPKLEETVKGGHLLLSLTSDSLIGTMWLQFVDWVQGALRVERCKHCKKWFSISLDTKRATAEYCGQSCRSKAYHARKKHSYELHIRGMKINEIAEELESSQEIVGKWIREAKQQEKTIRSRRRARAKNHSR